ncbi:DEAD/DEAH box helicase family protein [Microbacterium sp. 2P01SA-2]|uniref:DEAD/DEAH box helicase n=1 Tax=unclassified Microbacterium TaxID=2609290 RepID=UPI00399F01A7
MGTIEHYDIDGNELWWLSEGPGAHADGPQDSEVVETALKGRFRFAAGTETEDGLRRPQLGALHAILAYRSTEEHEPITVVMPTGTGKTETMLAAYCHSPAQTLVVVPSDALRTQIAEKFVTLGVLPRVRAVVGDFLCPAVLVLKSGLQTVDQVRQVLARSNVVVATAQVLDACSEEARSHLAKSCQRLFVDEAHHLGARTWRQVVELFNGREVVQFTATPYREDGRHLGGRIAYAYPLRLAQEHGYFARINYHSVIDLADPDRAVATAAVRQLRADVEAGLDHLLMARVRSVERAKEIIKLYEDLGSEFAPIRIDTGMAESTRSKHRNRLFNRESRIVVCVNMLGEGFDLSALKIAAIHDPQKSLAVTLQFVGRFTRVGNESLGEASAFVPLQVAGVDERLRKLYGEDADWNEVIRDLTEHGVGQEKDRTDFELAFGSVPREVAMRSIHPKMSTVTYQSTTLLSWNPESIYDLFEDRLLTTRIGINNKDKVAWWVSREATPVRWGDFSSFNELVHHLHVVHVDDASGFLYINSTNNDSMHEDIAQAIGGDDVTLIKGETVYRILSKVKRRVPTNVGLLDSVSRNRRFSMHVGQDVLHAWRGEGGTKMKTNIFAHGFADSRAVSFGASRKGRVWSHEQARDIHDWVRWATQVGPTITDTSISLDSVMSGFLLPEPARERPPYVPLSIEWPYQLVATFSERRKVSYKDQSFSLLDTELSLSSHTADQPLRFKLKTPGWELEFEFDFHEDGPPTIRPITEDGQIVTPAGTGSLAAFLTANGLLITFESETVLVEQGFLLRPDRERRLFPIDAIETIDWSNVDIKRESQGADRDPATIQHRAIQALSAEDEWEIVIDDDGAGELADVVLLKRAEDGLDVLMVHCKYSSGDKPGARIDDLYDVCGQAMKMNRAKSIPELLTKRLFRREQHRQSSGKSGLIAGNIATLAAIVREARYRTLNVSVAIVQPGLSKSLASEDMRALLGGTDRFLLETHGMRLRVIASP